MLGERIDYLDQIDFLKKGNTSVNEKQPILNNKFVIPVAFNKEGGKNMLSYVKLLMEKKGVVIHSRFNKLLVALRTATENDMGQLDKDAMAHSDVYDSFRMSLKRYV